MEQSQRPSARSKRYYKSLQSAYISHLILEIVANIVQYMFMLLSKGPEVLQKKRQEHDDVFDNASFDETLSRIQDNPQSLAELKYTAAVIRETLRLFPGGFGARVAEAGFVPNHY
jgi:cytochrome P450